MLELGLKSLLSYLLGSLLGALLVGRLRGTQDLRAVGSGNAGGTNALRTHGRLFALWVLLIDIGKGVLAVAVLPSLDIPGVGVDAQVNRQWLTMACAAAVILGHVYPLWFGFRGGKGAATFIGALAGIHPPLLLPVLVVWALVILITGYVGLGTICAGASLPLYVGFAGEPLSPPLLVFSIFFAAFVAYTHRGNIARLFAGNEHRVRRPWQRRQ